MSNQELIDRILAAQKVIAEKGRAGQASYIVPGYPDLSKFTVYIDPNQ